MHRGSRMHYNAVTHRKGSHMFKRLAAEALGISDVGVIIAPADYNKVDADDYLFHEDGEKIFFLIKSRKDEYLLHQLRSDPRRWRVGGLVEANDQALRIWITPRVAGDDRNGRHDRHGRRAQVLRR